MKPSLIHVLLLTAISNTCSGWRSQENLTRSLLENYVKSVKPEPSNGSRFNVTIGLTLLNLDDVDDDNRVIETHVYLDQTWIDERLAWEPSDFGDVRVLHMPATSVWIPDIVLFNNAGDDFKPMIDMTVLVYNDGTVNYVPPYHLKSFCDVDKAQTNVLSTFNLRYNELICKLNFGSWTYNGHEMNLVNRTSQIDMSEFRRFPADKFQVKSTSVQVNQKMYDCCPESYQTVTFTVFLSNNPRYYHDSAPVSAEDIAEAQARAQAQARGYPRRHSSRNDSPEDSDDHHHRSKEDWYG